MLSTTDREHIRAALGTLEGLEEARWQFARDHLTAVLAANTRKPDPPATVMPTDDQARRLYLTAGEGHVESCDHQDWPAIANEMRAVVATKTALAGGLAIRWWACWDREYTATAFARRVRREWRRMQGEAK